MKMEEKWLVNYNLCKEYYELHGHLMIPSTYIYKDACLGRWIADQRQLKKKGKLSIERICLLDEIEMIWNKEEYWQKMFEYCKSVYDTTGRLDISKDATYLGSYVLNWLKNSKRNASGKHKELLESIGIVFDNINACTWEQNFNLAKAYYEEHGDLIIPRNYKVGDINLGRWIATQRENKEKLSQERRDKLDSIGMVWSFRNTRNVDWNEAYILAKKYYENKGNLLVPWNYVVDNFNLGNWISVQRSKMKKLSKEQKALLDDIKMIWDLRQYKWNLYYKLCKDYYNEHGDLNIPDNYVVETYNLSAWIKQQRTYYRKGKLSDNEIILLEKLNIQWSTNKSTWSKIYPLFEQFYKENGHLNIPSNYIVQGFNLYYALSNYRRNYKEGVLSEVKIQALEKFNIFWTANEAKWAANYPLLEQFYKENGHLNIPENYIVDGVNLHKVLSNIRRKYNAGNLPNEEIRKLEKLNIIWSASEAKWIAQYRLLEQFYKENGHLNIPRGYIVEGVNLSMLLGGICQRYKEGILPVYKIKDLEKLHIIWNKNENKFFNKKFNKSNLTYRKLKLTKMLYEYLDQVQSNYEFNSYDDIKRLERQYVKTIYGDNYDKK